MRPASLGLLKRDGTPPWLFETLHSLVLGQQRSTTGLAAVIRGEAPDGSGNPLIDTTLFLYKPGLPGNQLAYGGTTAGGNLTLSSTAHSTKGPIYFGVTRLSVFDEVNTRIGLNQPTPTARLHMVVPPPVDQFWRPTSGSSSGIGASPIGAATVWQATNDTDPDTGGTSYVRWDFSLGFNATVTLTGTTTHITDPGTNVGWVIHVTMRTSTSDPAGPVMQMGLNVGGPSIFPGTVSWGNPTYGGGASEGNITSAFVRYSKTLSSTPVTGEAAQLRAALGTPWNITFNNAGLPPVGTWDISQVEIDIPNPGAGSAETLQKWATTGSILDQLDFGNDGGGGTDLQLTGNAEFYVGAGDATSGVRLYSASSAAWFEAGKTDQTNMVLNLAGIRQAVLTSLRISTLGVRVQNAAAVGAPSAIWHVVNSAGAANILERLVPHSSQSVDSWQLRNAADAANLAAFDSTGKIVLGVGFQLIPGAGAGRLLMSDGPGNGTWQTLSGAGVASNTEPYVTTASTGGLTAERVLTGTTSQIIVTDNGAGTGTVVLSTPQNLHTSTVFQVGTLGIGAAAGAGLELDVTGESYFRGQTTVDQQTSNDALVIHYRSNNISPGKVIHVIDDDGNVSEFYLDLFGVWRITELQMILSVGGFTHVQRMNAGLSADRLVTWPNISGIPIIDAGTQTLTGAKTFSGACVFTGNTVLEVSSAADVRFRDPTSGFLMFFDLSALTASRAHAFGNYSGFVASPVNEGTDTYILRSRGAGVQPTWDPPAAGSAHDILSATHSDTLAAAVTRGALLVGNATPKWSSLTIGAASTLLKSDGTDATWGTVTLLSAFHSDTVANTVTRGSIIYGNATPRWDELSLGSSGRILLSNGTDILWSDPLFSDDLFRIRDDGDISRQLEFEVSGISFSTTRLWTVQDWSGNPVVPASNGTLGQVLTSQGSGTQPNWTTPAAGGVTKGQATVDFTSAGAEMAVVTVADAAVASTSRIVASMAYTPTGSRDLDELEMEQFDVKPGNIIAGVSFDILVTCLSGGAHDTYFVDWHYS